MRNHEKHIANRFFFLSGLCSWWAPACLLAISLIFSHASWAQNQPGESLPAETIGVRVSPVDGSYTIFDPASPRAILHATVAVEADHHWIKSTDYPKHSIKSDHAIDDLGS